MSKIHIATIITSHYDKALTMLTSMRQFQDCHLHILFINFVFNMANAPKNENITIYTPERNQCSVIEYQFYFLQIVHQ